VYEVVQALVAAEAVLEGRHLGEWGSSLAERTEEGWHFCLELPDLLL